MKQSIPLDGREQLMLTFSYFPTAEVVKPSRKKATVAGETEGKDADDDEEDEGKASEGKEEDDGPDGDMDEGKHDNDAEENGAEGKDAEGKEDLEDASDDEEGKSSSK